MSETQQAKTGDLRRIGGLAAATSLVIVFVLFMIAARSAVAQEGGAPAGASADAQYIVQAGDVLERIAAQFDVSVACIIETNGLEQYGNLLFVGDVLVISATCPPYQGSLPVENPRFGDLTAAGVEGESVYIVQVADTLDTIGQEFNVSVVALFVANGLDYGSLIYPGQQLVIPAAPPYGFYPGLGGLAAGITEGDIYVIQPQDALDLVAAYFDKDLRCVLEANGITDTVRIQPGLMVVLPAACPPYSGLSSVPLRPLRGVGLVGASALLLETGENANGAPVGGVIVIPEATEEPAAPETTEEAPIEVPAEATATPGFELSTPVPAQTTTPMIMRGPTITPTPSG